MGRPITFKRPNFHFSKPLTTTRSTTTKRLLRNKRIWTNTTHVYLILNHVMKFEHVHIPNRDILDKRFPTLTIKKCHFATSIKSRLLKFVLNFVNCRPYKRRDNGLISKGTSRHT